MIIGIILLLVIIIINFINKKMKEFESLKKEVEFWRLLAESYKRHFSVNEIDGILHEIETTIMVTNPDALDMP